MTSYPPMVIEVEMGSDTSFMSGMTLQMD